MKHLAEIAGRVAKMSEDERAAIAASMPLVTVEGHALSLRNNIVAVLQTPAPLTIVGGFRQWLKHGRCVRKGERAIYILHPCAKKADDGETVQTYFKEAAIFDVSQTDPLPSE